MSNIIIIKFSGQMIKLREIEKYISTCIPEGKRMYYDKEDTSLSSLSTNTLFYETNTISEENLNNIALFIKYLSDVEMTVEYFIGLDKHIVKKYENDCFIKILDEDINENKKEIEIHFVYNSDSFSIDRVFRDKEECVKSLKNDFSKIKNKRFTSHLLGVIDWFITEEIDNYATAILEDNSYLEEDVEAWKYKLIIKNKNGNGKIELKTEDIHYIEDGAVIYAPEIYFFINKH